MGVPHELGEDVDADRGEEAEDHAHPAEVDGPIDLDGPRGDVDGLDLRVEERSALDGVAVLVDQAVLPVGLAAVAGDREGEDSKHS